MSETDGEIIEHYFGILNKDKYKITALLDPYPQIEYNNIYFYGIFPYDNNDYNYNTILSKDLHILNVSNLEISQSNINEQLYISYQDPDSSDWNRTKIIRKIGSIPANETDGVIIIDSTVHNQYKDSFFTDIGLVPGQYYGYKAITYDRWNNINRIAASATASPNLILDFDYEHMFNYYSNSGWNIISQPYINDASGIHIKNYIRASDKLTRAFTIKNIVVPNGKIGTLEFGYDFYQCKYESKAHFKILVNGFSMFSLNPLANEGVFETNKNITLQTGNNIIQFIYYGVKELHFPPYINIYNLKILYS